MTFWVIVGRAVLHIVGYLAVPDASSVPQIINNQKCPQILPYALCRARLPLESHYARAMLAQMWLLRQQPQHHREAR